eukprot:695689-Karenia_brevis.AAC.1
MPGSDTGVGGQKAPVPSSSSIGMVYGATSALTADATAIVGAGPKLHIKSPGGAKHSAIGTKVGMGGGGGT